MPQKSLAMDKPNICYFIVFANFGRFEFYRQMQTNTLI